MAGTPTSRAAFEALISQAIQNALTGAGTVCGPGAGCAGDTAGCEAAIIAALQ
jgi:hypothetical protein